MGSVGGPGSGEGMSPADWKAMASGITTATGIKDMPLIGGLAQMDGEAWFFLPALTPRGVFHRCHLSPLDDLIPSPDSNRIHLIVGVQRA
jgi:hypothetical protein